MIVSGGENVYPIEVEKTLASHPDVAEAAVIGVDDEQYGQRLAAFVVLNDGASASPDTLKQHVRESLANYKVPRQITVLDELPRSNTGKIVRRDLQGPRRQWRRRRRPLLRAARRTRQRRQRCAPTRPRRISDRGVVLRSAGRPPRWLRCTWPARCSTRCVRGLARRLQRAGVAESRLLLKVITWGLLGLIMYRNVKSEPYFETPLARDARRRLRGDRRTVTAGPTTTTRPDRRATP